MRRIRLVLEGVKRLVVELEDDTADETVGDVTGLDASVTIADGLSNLFGFTTEWSDE